MEQAYYEGFESAPPGVVQKQRKRTAQTAAERDLDPQYLSLGALNPGKVVDKVGDSIMDGLKKALDVIKKPIDEIKKFVDFLKDLPKNVWTWLVGFFGGAVWIVVLVLAVVAFAMLSGPVINAYKAVSAGGAVIGSVLAKPGHTPLPKSSALGGVTSFIKRGGGANSIIARVKTEGLTGLFSGKSGATAASATASATASAAASRGMTSMASALGRPSLAPITGMRPTSLAPTPSIAPTMQTAAAPTFPRVTGLPPRM